MKGAARSPAWAARGKLRMAHIFGGPSEAARIIYQQGWDGSPAGLLPVSRYGNELVDELLKRKINCVCLTWSPGFSLEGDVAQWEMVGRLLPLLKKKRIRAIAEVSLTGCYANEMFPRVPESQGWIERNADRTPVARSNTDCLQMNIKNAAWRQYLAHKVRMAAGAGFDGFYFSDAFSDPTETAGFVTELSGLARSARPPEGEELMIYSGNWRAEVLADACNFMFGQAALKPGLQSPTRLNSNLPDWKLLFELGGREKNFACAFHESLNGKEAALSAAEIFASGGTPCDNQTPQSYLDFATEHADLFGPSDPVNSVGILTGEDEKSMTRIASCAHDLGLLAMEQIQFDVIPVRSIEAFELRKYKVLSAVHLEKISPELAETLKKFASQYGGTLLCSAESDFGIQTPSENYTAGDSRAATPLGKGRALKYSSGLKDGAFTPDYFRYWVEDIKKYDGEQPISLDSVKGLVAVLWGKGTRRWVHVLNYRTETCNATITLPGCGGRKLEVHSPDVVKPQLSVLETGNAAAKFDVKNIETYAVVAVD
jgi:hypothetical protein